MCHQATRQHHVAWQVHELCMICTSDLTAFCGSPPARQDSLLYVSVSVTTLRQPSRSTATTLASLGLRRSAWACAACSVANLSGAMFPSGPTRLTARHAVSVRPSPGVG